MATEFGQDPKKYPEPKIISTADGSVPDTTGYGPRSTATDTNDASSSEDTYIGPRYKVADFAARIRKKDGAYEGVADRDLVAAFLKKNPGYMSALDHEDALHPQKPDTVKDNSSLVVDKSNPMAGQLTEAAAAQSTPPQGSGSASLLRAPAVPAPLLTRSETPGIKSPQEYEQDLHELHHQVTSGSAAAPAVPPSAATPPGSNENPAYWQARAADKTQPALTQEEVAALSPAARDALAQAGIGQFIEGKRQSADAAYAGAQKQNEAEAEAAVDQAFGKGAYAQSAQMEPAKRAQLVENAKNMALADTGHAAIKLSEDRADQQQRQRQVGQRNAQITTAQAKRQGQIEGIRSQWRAANAAAAVKADPDLAAKLTNEPERASTADVIKWARTHGAAQPSGGVTAAMGKVSRGDFAFKPETMAEQLSKTQFSTKEYAPGARNPNIHVVSPEAMTKQLKDISDQEEVWKAQDDVRHAPFAVQVIGQQWPRLMGEVQSALANIIQYPERLTPSGRLVSALPIYKKPEEAWHNLTAGLAGYLRQRADLSNQIGNYAPPEEAQSYSKSFARSITNMGYDAGKIIALTELTGAPFEYVMAGEAAIQAADKDPVTQGKAVTRAYLTALGLKYGPGLITKGAESILPEAITKLMAAAPKATERVIGATGFGGLSAGETALAGGTKQQIAGAGAGGAIFGALTAGGGPGELARKFKEIPAKVIASENAPEWVREVAGVATGRKPVIVQTEGSATEPARYSSVYVKPGTNDVVAREVSAEEGSSLLQKDRPARIITDAQFNELHPSEPGAAATDVQPMNRQIGTTAPGSAATPADVVPEPPKPATPADLAATSSGTAAPAREVEDKIVTNVTRNAGGHDALLADYTGEGLRKVLGIGPNLPLAKFVERGYVEQNDDGTYRFSNSIRARVPVKVRQSNEPGTERRAEPKRTPEQNLAFATESAERYGGSVTRLDDGRYEVKFPDRTQVVEPGNVMDTVRPYINAAHIVPDTAKSGEPTAAEERQLTKDFIAKSSQAAPVQGSAAEVVEQGHSDPIRPPSDRWTGDRGAQPGADPILTLDGDGETGAAAIWEREVPGRGVIYEANLAGGYLIGRFSTVEEAAQAAEEAVAKESQPTSGIETPAAKPATTQTAGVEVQPEAAQPVRAETTAPALKTQKDIIASLGHVNIREQQRVNKPPAIQFDLGDMKGPAGGPITVTRYIEPGTPAEMRAQIESAIAEKKEVFAKAAEAKAPAKEPWQMRGVQLSSKKAEEIFPLKTEVETKTGRPVYTYSTTVQFGGEQRTFEIEARSQPNAVTMVERLHKQIVEQAIKDGKPVPPEVLADYPDLAAKTSTPEPSTVDVAAHDAAHSPTNDRPEPTQPQKEAGNYKKGHVRVAGLNLSVEIPEGGERSGVDKSGKKWSVTMKSHYGYIRGYEGADHEHVDIFIKPGTPLDYTGPVFVVNQKNKAGRLDEHKVMLGFPNQEMARRGYLDNYEKGWQGLKSIAHFADPAAFRNWLETGDLHKVAETPQRTPEEIEQIREENARSTADMQNWAFLHTNRRILAEGKWPNGKKFKPGDREKLEADIAALEKVAPTKSPFQTPEEWEKAHPGRSYGGSDNAQAIRSDQAVIPEPGQVVEGREVDSSSDVHQEREDGQPDVAGDESARRPAGESLPGRRGKAKKPETPVSEIEAKTKEFTDRLNQVKQIRSVAQLRALYTEMRAYRDSVGPYAKLTKLITGINGILERLPPDTTDTAEMEFDRQFAELMAEEPPVDSTDAEFDRQFAELAGEEKPDLEQPTPEATAGSGLSALNDDISTLDARQLRARLADIDRQIQTGGSMKKHARRSEIVAALQAKALGSTSPAKPAAPDLPPKRIDYDLMQRNYRKQKTALSKALKITDLRARKVAVIAAATKAVNEWGDNPWPDNWSRWQRAIDDVHKFGEHPPQLEDLTATPTKPATAPAVSPKPATAPGSKPFFREADLIPTKPAAMPAPTTDPALQQIRTHGVVYRDNVMMKVVELDTGGYGVEQKVNGARQSPLPGTGITMAEAQQEAADRLNRLTLTPDYIERIAKELEDHHWDEEDVTPNQLSGFQQVQGAIEEGREPDRDDVFDMMSMRSRLIEAGKVPNDDGLTLKPEKPVTVADLAQDQFREKLHGIPQETQDILKAHDTKGATPIPPTVAVSAKKAAGEVAMSLDDALHGIAELLKSGAKGDTSGSGPVFDDEAYAKAKPFFITALRHLMAAGASLKDAISQLLRQLKEKMNLSLEQLAELRPLIVQFMRDVESGKINLNAKPGEEEARPAGQPSKPTSLEVWERNMLDGGYDTRAIREAIKAARGLGINPARFDELAQVYDYINEVLDNPGFRASEAALGRVTPIDKTATKEEALTNANETKPHGNDKAQATGEKPAAISGTGAQPGATAVAGGASGRGAGDVRGTDRPGNGRDGEVQGAESGEAETLPAGAASSGGSGDQPSPRSSYPGNQQFDRDGAHDYVAPAGSLHREGSWKAAATTNLDIIELVKKIEAENRLATQAEQSQLVKYIGWGATELANNMFPGVDYGGRNSERKIRPEYARHGWEDVTTRAADLFSEEELKRAMNSMRNAHYTSEGITRGIWDALKQFGFAHGTILEGGMGIGLFPITAPKDLMQQSRYTGIERDIFTARIAKLLLPNHAALNADFVSQKLPKNFFDASVGNYPFADTVVSDDPAYRKFRFRLHDYFIAKTLDSIRPGGVQIFVTSNGTMDKGSDKLRKYVNDRADLIGAIRLPQTAFKQNAGTEVVTDIIFLRKRLPGEEPAGEQWMGRAEVTAKNEDGQMVTDSVNEYYVAHPEMVMGEHSFQGSMYGKNQYTVLPREGDIDEHVANAIKTLPTGIYAAQAKTEAIIKEATARDFSPTMKKEGSIYLHSDGTIRRVQDGSGVVLNEVERITKPEEKWLRDYVGLRTALKTAQRDQLTDGDWETSLKALNDTYDAFVKKHGKILENTESIRTFIDPDGNEQEKIMHRFKNKRVLGMDIESPLVQQLEVLNDANELEKAPPLLSRQINPPKEAEILALSDALAVSLDQNGGLNLPHITGLMQELSPGMTQDDLIEQLGDAIFESPGGGWQMADEYLSGFVVDKMEEAQVAAQTDKRYQRNVDALQKVQPRPLSPANITVQLGANWVPIDVYNTFAREIVQVPDSVGTPPVTYNPLDNKYTVTAAHGSGSQSLRGAEHDWGTERRSPAELFESAMNGQVERLGDTDSDGKFWLDQTGTDAANELIKRMKREIQSWVWTDADRAKRITDLYNRVANNIAPRFFNGDHLSLPGYCGPELYSHQKRAVWRIIQAGTTYLAHAVGSGKTLEMIVSAMEMRRLGLINKPLFVVPIWTLKQFQQEFLQAYPLAKILVADDENFSADKRKSFVAQAALNDLDAVIISHSAFGLIDTTEETSNIVVDEMIGQLREAMEAIDEDTTDQKEKRTRKQIEARIEKIERQFKGKQASENRDQVVNFEDLGTDFLYVDEAHEFRKLDFITNQPQKGVTPEGSKKALDLLVKLRWLESKRPGRSAVLASGTPITNTMAELYTVQRYLGQGELDAMGLHHFDAWAAMFGEAVPDLELNAKGAFETVTRFNQFVNIPELGKRVRQFMDVLTMDQLSQKVDLPPLKGGFPELVLIPETDEAHEYRTGELAHRYDDSKAWKPTYSEPNNPDPIIAIITDGKLAALDMRFINNQLPSNPGSKLNKFIDSLIENYQKFNDLQYVNPKTKEPDPIKGATHIVFSFLGFGKGIIKNRGFDSKAWVIKRLTDSGIPASEIAFMDDYKKPREKQAMFSEMRNGRKKILIGSPMNMGTGLNVQNRLRVSYFLAPPWFPAHVQQPDGRIVRQGNQNDEIQLLRFGVERTYDATGWQMVAKKAKMIEQFFLGDDSVRKISDISESSVYEQAAALLAGDQRAIQLAGLRRDVESLHRSMDAHRRQQNDMRYAKSSAENSIASDKSELKDVDAALEEVGHGGYIMAADFFAKDGSTTIAKRTDIGEAIKARVQEAWDRYVPDIIKKDGPAKSVELPVLIQGKFKIKAILSANFSRAKDEKDKPGTPFARLQFHIGELLEDIGGSWSIKNPADIDAQGLATRVFNALNQVRKTKSSIETKIAENQRTLKQVNSKLGAPFSQEAELYDKQAEMSALEMELSGANDVAAPVAPTVADIEQKKFTARHEKWDAQLRAGKDVSDKHAAMDTPEKAASAIVAHLQSELARFKQAEEHDDLQAKKMIDNDVNNYLLQDADAIANLTGRPFAEKAMDYWKAIKRQKAVEEVKLEDTAPERRPAFIPPRGPNRRGVGPKPSTVDAFGDGGHGGAFRTQSAGRARPRASAGVDQYGDVGSQPGTRRNQFKGGSSQDDLDIWNELDRLIKDVQRPPGQKARKLPEHMADAGLDSGTNLNYDPSTIAEGIDVGRQMVADKGIDGAMEFVRTGDGIAWASTGYEVLAQLRDQESAARRTDPGKADKIAEKRLKFLDDFVERSTRIGQAIAGIRAIIQFSPDRAAYEANRISIKERGHGLSAEEEKRITADAEEWDALRQRNAQLEDSIAYRIQVASELEDELAAERKRANRRENPVVYEYEKKLTEQATEVKEQLTVKIGHLDFGNLKIEEAFPGQKGAVGDIGRLPGDAELLAQYAASQLGKLDTVAALNEHMVREFGPEVEPYLRVIRRRAYQLRQNARLTEMAAAETTDTRRRTILDEIRKDITDAQKAIRKRYDDQEREAKERKKAATAAEKSDRARFAREERQRLKQTKTQYAEAAKAQDKGYREMVRERNEAARLAALWDTPLRDAAAAARERLASARADDPDVLRDLVSAAVSYLLPDERSATVGMKAIEPTVFYRDLKAEFPGLVTRKNQREIYRRAFEILKDTQAAAREAARLRNASKAAQKLWETAGVDAELQGLLIQKAENARQQSEVQRRMVAEFRTVSQSTAAKVWSWTLGSNMNGFLRAAMSSIDAPLGRQGLYPILTHPIRMLRSSVPATARGYGAFRQSDISALDEDIKAHPRYELFKRIGGDLTEVGGGGKDPLLYAEEQFGSPIADKLPHIRQSELGYTAGMNVIRLDFFDVFATGLEKNGYNETDNEEQFKTVAGLVNKSTGRGSLPEWVKQATKTTNWLFFATRFGISHAQMLNDLFNPVKYLPARFNPLKVHSIPGFDAYDPVVRKMQLAQLARLGLMFAALYGLAKLLGFDVSGFPIVRVGNSRYDLSGGKVSMVKAVMKVAEGVNAAAHGRPSKDIFMEAAHFLRGKLAPVPSAIADSYYHKNVVGQPANWTIQAPGKMLQENILINRLQPIVFGDFEDAWADSGPWGLVKATPALTGLGVNTYPDKGVAAVKNKAITKALARFDFKPAEIYGNKTKDEVLDSLIEKGVNAGLETMRPPSAPLGEAGQALQLKNDIAKLRNEVRAEVKRSEPERWKKFMDSDKSGRDKAYEEETGQPAPSAPRAPRDAGATRKPRTAGAPQYAPPR